MLGPVPPSPLHEEVDAYVSRETDLDASVLLGYDGPEGPFEDNTCCGLVNLGNTCWGNALVQVLTRVHPIRKWLWEHRQQASGEAAHAEECPLCLLGGDVERLATLPQNEPFAPGTLVSRASWNPEFAGFAQQDGHEAFVTLLDRCEAVDFARLRDLSGELPELAAALGTTRARYTTPFWKILGGLQTSTTRCSQCSKTIVKHEMFHNLLLTIPDGEDPSVQGALLANLGTEALLDGDRCRRCGTENTRQKTTEVVSWPQALVLNVKRFEQDAWTGERSKIETHIAFDVVMPLPGSPPFRLRGVVIHSGDFEGGHYTAVVRGRDDVWYYCDDAAGPRAVSVEFVLSAQAYILVYER